MVDVGAGCVRNLFGAGHRNLPTDGVRHLLVADFRHHASAADLLLHRARHPAFAANGLRRSRAADFLHAARIAGIRDTLFDHRARYTLGVRFPTTAADVHRLCFSHRLHDRIATVFVAGLSFRAVRGVAAVAVAGFVDRLADVVAHVAVARLVNRLADRVTNVAVARLVTGFANVAGHGSPAGFRHRPTHLTLHATVMSFVHRLAHRVTFVAVLCLVDVAHARHRNGFRASIHDNSHGLALLLFPYNFLNGFVLNTAPALCVGEIATRVAGTCRHTGVASRAQQTGV